MTDRGQIPDQFLGLGEESGITEFKAFDPTDHAFGESPGRGGAETRGEFEVLRDPPEHLAEFGDPEARIGREVPERQGGVPA